MRGHRGCEPASMHGLDRVHRELGHFYLGLSGKVCSFTPWDPAQRVASRPDERSALTVRAVPVPAGGRVLAAAGIGRAPTEVGRTPQAAAGTRPAGRSRSALSRPSGVHAARGVPCSLALLSRRSIGSGSPGRSGRTWRARAERGAFDGCLPDLAWLSTSVDPVPSHPPPSLACVRKELTRTDVYTTRDCAHAKPAAAGRAPEKKSRQPRPRRGSRRQAASIGRSTRPGQPAPAPAGGSGEMERSAANSTGGASHRPQAHSTGD